MRKRWIALLVENQVGVLSKVSGLFSGKAYNLQTLTVGTTEDESISRMTISVMSDDVTFEQIKKQLNRFVEVIKVIDLSETAVYMKEIMFATISGLDDNQMAQAMRFAKAFDINVKDIKKDALLFECFFSQRKNDDLIDRLKREFKHVSIVRGGAVAIESFSRTQIGKY